MNNNLKQQFFYMPLLVCQILVEEFWPTVRSNIEVSGYFLIIASLSS